MAWLFVSCKKTDCAPAVDCYTCTTIVNTKTDSAGLVTEATIYNDTALCGVNDQYARKYAEDRSYITTTYGAYWQRTEYTTICK